MFGFSLTKTLEVRAKWAHLVGLLPLLHAPSNARDSVRELFTISIIDAFEEGGSIRPVRSIRALCSRRAPRRSGGACRGGCGGRDCGARHLAGRRGARRPR